MIKNLIWAFVILIYIPIKVFIRRILTNSPISSPFDELFVQLVRSYMSLGVYPAKFLIAIPSKLFLLFKRNLIFQVNGRQGNKWIGEEISLVDPNSIIIFQIHGGGFACGAPADWLFAYEYLLNQLAKRGVPARIYAVGYPLTPDNIYPSQLNYCIEEYTFLLSLGVPSKRIVVMGDSAGGNLAITMLIELVKRGVELPRATIPISPWIRIGQTYPDENEDILSNKSIKSFADIYSLWKQQSLSTINPLNAEKDVLERIFGGGKCSMLISFGSLELIKQDAIDFYEHVRRNVSDCHILLDEGKRAVHIFQCLYPLFYAESKRGLHKIADFIASIAALLDQ
jgi:epsilon-lactone hydrolase